MKRLLYVIFYDCDDGDYLRVINISDTTEAKELLKPIGLVDIFYEDVELVKISFRFNLIKNPE